MSSRAAALLLLAGCGSTLRGYPGDRLPEEDTAVIVSRSAKSLRVDIVAIDGTEVEGLWDRGDRLELMPGQHVITLDLTTRIKRLVVPLDPGAALTEAMFAGANALTATRASVSVAVTVEAGKRYIFVARVASEGQAEYEITDAETGATVAARQVED